MIKLKIDNTEMLIADEWSKIGIDTLRAYATRYYAMLNSLITKNDEGETIIKDSIDWRRMQFHLLHGLIPCKTRSFFKQINVSVANELIDKHKVIDFLITDLKPFKQLMPKIKGYLGPLEFGFITTAEFALADIQYLLVKKAMADDDQQRTLKHLKLFAAILYRPQSIWKRWGDKRIALNKATIDIRAQRIGDKMEDLLCALIWYESYRKAFPDKYKYAFENNDDSGAASESLPDWQAAMLAIAESGTFGTFYQIEQTPVSYFLKEIDRKKRIIKEQREYNEKLKDHGV